MIIKVRNTGKTPATVNRIVIRCKAVGDGQAFPPLPDYEEGKDPEPTEYFLTVGGGYFKNLQFQEIRPTDGEIRVYGFVDYTDVFNRKWRSGYARVVNPDIPMGKNNLEFVLQPGWNYDRSRGNGE